MKKLRRRLGPLRDADVMIGNLSKMKTGAHASAARWMTDTLSSQRDAARTEAARQTPGKVLAKLASWWDIRAGIADCREAVDSLLSQTIHLRLDAFIEQAGQTGNPHELRIIGKGLRYTLEMAAEQGRPLPKSVLRTFKTIQQFLGDWHDNVVIVQSALRSSLDIGLPYQDMALQQQVLNLARLFATRAQKEFAKFAKTWSDDGAALATQIRQAFPLTHSVIESKTDPDPPDSVEPAAPEAPASGVAADA